MTNEPRFKLFWDNGKKPRIVTLDDINEMGEDFGIVARIEEYPKPPNIEEIKAAARLEAIEEATNIFLKYIEDKYEYGPFKIGTMGEIKMSNHRKNIEKLLKNH